MALTGLSAWHGMLLILIGAFLRAVYTINNKQSLRGISPRFLLVVNMIGAGLITLTIMFAIHPPQDVVWLLWPTGVIWPLLATALLNIVVQYTDITALSLEDASLVSPMSAASPLFAVFTGLLFLQEMPKPLGWLGILVISVGSTILSGEISAANKKNLYSYGVSIAKSILTPWRALSKSRGVRIALLGAFVASVSIIFDKLVVVRSGNPFLLSAVVFPFVGCMLLPRIRKEDIPRGLSRRNLVALALGPVLFAAAVFLFAVALPLVPASYSSALRRTSILFVILLSIPILKEGGHPERLWGGALMAVGAALLAL